MSITTDDLIYRSHIPRIVKISCNGKIATAKSYLTANQHWVICPICGKEINKNSCHVTNHKWIDENLAETNDIN